MSRATSLLPIRSEEALVLKYKQVELSSSIVMTDTEEIFTDPTHQLAHSFLKSYIIYKPLTLTTTRTTTHLEPYLKLLLQDTGKESGLDRTRPPILQIPDTMLNDTIREMDVYKEMWKFGGKGPMMRGEEFVAHVESFKTKIVLSTKRKPATKSKKVKEMYVDDPDQIHAATLLSVESERIRLERIEREQRMAEEEINDIDQTPSSTKLETINEGDEDDASNYMVFVHDKEKLVNEKDTPITKTLSSPRTESSQDDVLHYLNEPPSPSLRDVGYPKNVGTSRLNSYDGSSRKEKLSGDSAIQEKAEEQQRRINEFIAGKVPAAVQESVSTQVIHEVKNHTPTLVPNVVADFIRPCLHKVVSHVLRTEQINKQATLKDSCKEAKLNKRTYDDQDPLENRKEGKGTRSKDSEDRKDGYELFRNRFMSKAKYDYNMDQMKIAMFEDIDLETDQVLGVDCNKPLPLVGP
ncbi:hypothetical protein Tco_0618783 [Tanacetum coccineum]